MNSDYLSNQDIISENEWVAAKEEAQVYFNRIISETKEEVSNSFKHILNNAAAGLRILDRDYPAEQRLDIYNDTKSILEDTKTYYSLLEQYPEFREREQNLGEGAFPEIFEKGLTNKETIEAYKNKLINKA